MDAAAGGDENKLTEVLGVHRKGGQGEVIRPDCKGYSPIARRLTEAVEGSHGEIVLIYEQKLKALMDDIPYRFAQGGRV